MVKKRESQTKAFSEWYEKNKVTLNKRRKAKYKKDKEYRESVKSNTDKRYKERNGILEDGLRIIKSSNRTFVVHKLTDAADLLDVNIHTLRWYITSGYLPKFKVDNSTMRVITIDQMPLVAEFLKRIETESVGTVSLEMKPYLKKHWRDRHGSKEEISNQKEKG